MYFLVFIKKIILNFNVISVFLKDEDATSSNKNDAEDTKVFEIM